MAGLVVVELNMMLSLNPDSGGRACFTRQLFGGFPCLCCLG